MAALLKTLVKFHPMFEYPFFIEFGTLLGAVREGTFLSWDYDIDIGILEEDWRPRYKRQIKEAGFKTRTIYWKGWRTCVGTTTSKPGKVLCWHKSVPLSIHIYARGQVEGMRHAANPRWIISVPEYLLRPTGKIQLAGLEVNAPKDHEGLLSYIYGPDWQTPIRKFPKSRRHYRIYKGAWPT